ncbi:MAG: hypothetical protein JSV88_12760 [Candidatus Aminicenantes bacterium]|nr:MAG: hypothetical protein JSV88_12760 [Candidatus Aminicenantes bacterium]
MSTLNSIKNCNCRHFFPGGSNMDENIARMMEHLQIPAMRLALIAEYKRLKEIFKPLIDEFDEDQEKIKSKEVTG